MLVFAFEPRLTTSILDQLKVDQKYRLRSSQESIDQLISQIEESNIVKCIGLGVYSGRDQADIRIEKICTDTFRKKRGQIQQIHLNNFLLPISGTKFGYAMGNSWCNLVSYRIMQRVLEKNLKLEYSFLHVPRRLNQKEATSRVTSLLNY